MISILGSLIIFLMNSGLFLMIILMILGENYILFSSRENIENILRLSLINGAVLTLCMFHILMIRKNRGN